MLIVIKKNINLYQKLVLNYKPDSSLNYALEEGLSKFRYLFLLLNLSHSNKLRLC
jgi:hypothetical protein